MESLFVGMDIGTSGCRVFIIDEHERVVSQAAQALPPSTVINGHVTQQPQDWWKCCQQVLKKALGQVEKNRIKALAIDGTSGSVLLSDGNGTVLSDAFMYNDNHNAEQARLIAQYAPRESAAHGTSSGLAKCLSLVNDKSLAEDCVCLNQADWITGKFLNRFDFSDENNALKMGYDVLQRCWPAWIAKVINPKLLPSTIYQPGEVVGQIDEAVAADLGLNNDVNIVAGTTDSIAAFIASGAKHIGDAVTSLGSTLAVKLISDSPVFAPEFGIYSHRLGDVWLAGGASNTGGAVLKHFFSQQQLDQMTTEINVDQPTDHNYYPLLCKGERFPVNNSELAPQLQPRPDSNTEFFQGILEGIARIEKQSYDKLAELGAATPTRIITMGGGSKNIPWRRIREKICGINVVNAEIDEAAYGSALLAKRTK